MKQKIEKLKIIKGKELKDFLKCLNSQFGITKIPGELFMRGTEKVFLFTGNFKEEIISNIENKIFVERIGTYIAKKIKDKYRLSIEGSQIFKDQINKNIIELSYEEMIEWMQGGEILKITNKKGFVVMKYKSDMLGTGNASETKITNFIPKSRRLKRKEN